MLAPAYKLTTNDLLNQVFPTMEKIQVATLCMLPLLETKIDQIAHYYRRVDECAYWVNWLGNNLLLRRCELLTIHYPENEEA